MRKCGDEWRVIDPKNQYVLSINPDEAQTIEGARRAIDNANERAERSGYSKQQFAICNREWYTYYDDNGNFIKSEEVVQMVELYQS